MNNKDLMISELTSYERDNDIINDIYRVFGDRADEFIEYIVDLYNQINLDTATWGLDIWEENMGIENNKDLTYEQRRNNIRIKIRRMGRVNTVMFKDILQGYYKNKVEVRFSGKLWFRIPLEGNSYLQHDTLYNMINSIKPAHLGYDIEFYLYTEKVGLNTLSTILSGENIVVFPYRVPSIELNTKTYVGVGNDISSDVTEIFPRGGN